MANLNKVLIGNFLKRIRRPVDIEKNKEYKLLTVRLHHKGIVLRCMKKGSEIGTKKMYTVNTGDFILSGIDARNGAFGIVPEEMDGAVVTNDFWYFKVDANVIDKRLFLELTQTRWFDEICRKGSDGTTQRIRLQKDKFYNQEIQLPSKTNHDTLLNKIISVKTCSKNLYTKITHQQSLLKKLRQSILQDAISGKLTDKWRRDNPDREPATELLLRIQAEKERLVKEKKIKKPKSLPSISKDEIPFELPEGWAWCRLGDYFQFIDYRGRTPRKSKDGVRLITAKNIRMGNIDNNPVEYITDELYKEWMTRGYPETGDLLFVTEGATMGFIATIKMEYKFALAQRTINLKPIIKINCEGIKYFIMSPLFQKTLKDNCTGSAATATGVKAAVLKTLLLPIPPLVEQEVIVSKVEKLFIYCDELEQKISKSRQNSELLMRAVLKEAFSGGGE